MTAANDEVIPYPINHFETCVSALFEKKKKNVED
jgi:hypothetical protein